MFDVEMPHLEHEKFICTECYQLGAHGDVTYGNWAEYLCKLCTVGVIIIVPSLLYMIIIFCFFLVSAIFNRGLPDSHALIDPFPLFQYLPEKPHTVKVCPHCKKVNTEAKIKDHNGQTALYFHKKNGLHLRNEPAEKPEVKERKHDPEEF